MMKHLLSKQLRRQIGVLTLLCAGLLALGCAQARQASFSTIWGAGKNAASNAATKVANLVRREKKDNGFRRIGCGRNRRGAERR